MQRCQDPSSIKSAAITINSLCPLLVFLECFIVIFEPVDIAVTGRNHIGACVVVIAVPSIHTTAICEWVKAFQKILVK